MYMCMGIGVRLAFKIHMWVAMFQLVQIKIEIKLIEMVYSGFILHVMVVYICLVPDTYT